MLGWANVWTRPIQNRVDMLASGVNSEVGVRVLGDDFDAIVNTSEAIAEVIGMITGAENVIADPIRGKDEVQFFPDSRRFAELGLDETEAQSVFELAKSGRVLAPPLDSGLKPRRLLITSPAVDSLGTLTVTSGPASIKSENGSLRNYVRFNVRGRQPQDVIDDAKLAIAKNVPLPAGVSIQWTGQYEHASRTRATLLWMIPVVVTLIGVVLYAVFRDAVDACLMLIAVPGALAGGVVCQWLLGYPFSVAVGIGYIACFGMAAATSMIMLVYMRESVTRAGALSDLSTDELRLAVIDGAVHRLRPKLLTEATMILALAPMLWSSGAGADIIRPMAAPVLGGILIADEVVDLLIPLLFYASRRQRQLQFRISTP
jgi:copper/silver efflux system protein